MNRRQSKTNRSESATRFRLLRLESLEGRSLLAGILSGGITEFVVTRHSESAPPAHTDIQSDTSNQRHSFTTNSLNQPIRTVGSPLPLNHSESPDSRSSISEWLGSHGSRSEKMGPQRPDEGTSRNRSDDRRRPTEGEGEPSPSVPVVTQPATDAPSRPSPATVLQPRLPNDALLAIPTTPTQGSVGQPTVDPSTQSTSNSAVDVAAFQFNAQDNPSPAFDQSIGSDFASDDSSVLFRQEVGLVPAGQNDLTTSGLSASDQFRLRTLGESLESKAEQLALVHGIDHALSQLLIPSQFETNATSVGHHSEIRSQLETRSFALDHAARNAALAEHYPDDTDGLMAIDLSEQLLPTLYSTADKLDSDSAWDQPLAMTRGQGYETAGLAFRQSVADSSRVAQRNRGSSHDTDETLERLRPVIAIASATVGAAFLGHRRQKEADEKRKANNGQLK